MTVSAAPKSCGWLMWPPPEPARGQVLVRLRAAGLNPLVWKMQRGVVKILTGQRFPQGPGLEFAGTVERIDARVTVYLSGEAVFGAAKYCPVE
jgi:NADPH:quinone reductase-like Zn-dependent oxidoreductase